MACLPPSLGGLPLAERGWVLATPAACEALRSGAYCIKRVVLACPSDGGGAINVLHIGIVGSVWRR